MERLLVPAIHCSSCEDYLKSALSVIPQLRDLSISVLQHSLTFSVDDKEGDPLSRETLLQAVQRILEAAGYPSHRVQSETRPGGIRRFINAAFGNDRRRHQRHLEHCNACQLEEDASRSEKGEGSSLQAVHVEEPSAPKIFESRFGIEGMTCSSCSGTITRHVQSLPGVTYADVNLVLNSATIKHAPDITSVANLIEEIENLGYGASLVSSDELGKSPLKRTTFGLKGMTCSSCSGTINSAIRAIDGVQSVSVSLIANSMEVVHDASLAPESKIIEVVTGCGYDAEVWKSADLDASDIRREKSGTRTVTLLLQGECEECPGRINRRLESLDLISFTPVSMDNWISVITYAPTSTTNIRSLLAFDKPVKASLYQPPSMAARSRDVQERETVRLTRLWLASFVIAIPTFIFAVVGMSLVPKKNGFRKWCEKPIWGGAMRSVIALWILATLVQGYVNRVFYERAWKSVSSHGPWKWSRLVHFGNMDLLVALSTTVAYCASLGMMARDVSRSAESVMRTGSSTYFDSCVFLAFFILMGRVLEGRARVKTGDAIALLGSMRPESALLVYPINSGKAEDETIEFSTASPTSIPADQIELGDHLLIQPGGVPPADGEVASGQTTFDESSLTGEFMPVTKRVGDAIMTGTVNLTTPIVIRVNNVGDETMLQKIVHAVAEGQSRKAPIERVADRITSVFIPIVVYLSLAVLIIWLGVSLGHAIPLSYLPEGRTGDSDRVFFAFEFAISCLVIACPCGIGLAAPTAQAVGAGMAARAGILAQGGGEAFQAAANVDTVVFDKTGTLTLGEAVVVDALISSDSPAWVLPAVRLLEGGSSHPLALAIAKYCADHDDGASGVRIMESREVSGRGVQATINLGDDPSLVYSVYVGNEAFIIDENYATVSPQMLTPQVQKWRESGHSVVLVATSTGSVEKSVAGERDFEVVAFLAIADTIRPESEQTVTKLQTSGREVFMLTGDNETTARAVAAQLGIDSEHVKAGVLPHQKADFIAALQDRRSIQRTWWGLRSPERRSIVAFCGDGLNDSAALARADVGIALAHGSQVTIAAASFVLLSRSSIPFSTVTLLDISRKVYNRQKMNFGWAMIYNTALIPIAAGVLYPYKNTRLPPVWSALAMALSSVSVVMSSLALQWGL